MKKILLFFSLSFLLLNTKAQTSVYHPFPDSNAVWNMGRSGGLQSCYNSGYHENFSYIFIGDTVINTRTYHQLFIPFVQKTDTCTMIGWHTSPGYAGCIRQDTVGKKVFFIAPGSSSEYVLYDFNL